MEILKLFDKTCLYHCTSGSKCEQAYVCTKVDLGCVWWCKVDFTFSVMCFDSSHCFDF